MRPPSADVPPRAKVGAPWSGRPTVPHRSVEGGPRWLIQVEGGEFQLVESEQELAELARLGRLTESTPVYAVPDGPRALGEVPELARLVGGAHPSEPPIRLVHRSPERDFLSEELAILDRPLEDEIEYYDEVPVRRWPRRVAFVLAVAAGVLGAYLLVLPRFPNWQSAVTARLALPARSWVGGTSAARAIPAQPAALAARARAEGAAPVASPAIAPSPATSSPVAAIVKEAPIADRETRTAEVHEGRSHHRHRSGNHARSGR